MEEWKPIDGVPGYEISNYGRVRSLKGQVPLILKTKILPNGYERANISNKDSRFYEYVHRLVAKAFVPNPKGEPWVNHIDGNKLNNRAENLEWVTPSSNSKHAFRQGLNKINENQKAAFIARTRSLLGKKIEQLTIEGLLVRVWDNACDTQKQLGFDRANIATAARKGLVRYGYRWRYIS